jgi:glycosyltransferase domain-containing protein
MLIEDDNVFSLVIPTFEGTPFVRRCLEYLQAVAFRGRVVLADDSSGEHRAFVESSPASYPELWLDVHRFSHGTPFLDKLRRSLDQLPSRFVMLCGQDDFVVPDGVERVVRNLDADAGLSCARGRVARFHLQRKAGATSGADRVAVEFHQHPMSAYSDARAVDRVLAHVRSYSSALYSVHRRSLLIESFRRTQIATQNVIFMQYLSSCITAAQGRIACVDAVFLARQAHAASWAARLRRDSEHWPLLVASPNFSGYYQEFRNAVLDLLRGEPGADDGLGGRIDDAFVDLVKLGLCRLASALDPDDEAFFARLKTKGTGEHRAIEPIVNCALAHPDTY